MCSNPGTRNTRSFSMPGYLARGSPSHIRVSGEQCEGLGGLNEETKRGFEVSLARKVIRILVEIETGLGLNEVSRSHRGLDFLWPSMSRRRFSAQKCSSASIDSPEFSPATASILSPSSAASSSRAIRSM